MVWWYWLVAGLVLIGLELVVPSFTIVWFGLAALLVAPFAWLFPALPVGALLLSWALLSTLFALAWFRFGRGARPSVVGSASDGVVGQVGTVTKTADDGGLGIVTFQAALLGSREWPCRSDEVLVAGGRVKVVEIVGHTMKVTTQGVL